MPHTFGSVSTDADIKKVIGGWSDPFVVSHTDLQDASTSGEITIFTAAAGEEIVSCFVEPTSEFVGGGITDYTVEVGIAGDENRYKSAFDVTQILDQGVKTNLNDIPNWTGTTAIIVTGRSAGANTDQTIQGSVNIYVRTIKVKE